MKLYTPGPVPVPQRVMDAASQPMIHHHSEEFRQVLARTRDNLARIIGTEQTVVLMSGSATTAIDSLAAACIRPDDRVMVLRHGRFGQRLADCCAIHGAKVLNCSAPWGGSITADEFRTALLNELAEGPLRAIWLVHSETSTGVSLDVEGISGVLREYSPETLLLVDGVTSVAVQRLKMDEWHLDAVVTGTQKGLMSPPGLGIAAISKRLEESVWDATSRLYSNDLRRVLATHRSGLMLWTPPVSVVRALEVASTMILDEGMEHIWQRHDELHAYVMHEAQLRGFQPFGLATSRALLALSRPDVAELRTELKSRCAMHVADGQDELSGKIMRIGICGSYTHQDMSELLSAIDMIDSTSTRTYV